MLPYWAPDCVTHAAAVDALVEQWCAMCERLFPENYAEES